MFGSNGLACRGALWGAVLLGAVLSLSATGCGGCNAGLIVGSDSGDRKGTDGGAAGSDGSAVGTDGGSTGTDGGISTPTCIDEEVCGDGLDNDCNGAADDNCVCSTPGEVRTCYTGPIGTLGVGRCSEGSQTCGDMAGKFAYWGPCEGDVVPGAEDCNGLDDDCNGDTDEGLGDLSCGVGACAVTVAACSDGAWQTCTAGVPAAESCNGLDDDCDGSTDEGLGTLTCGVGACAASAPACTGGVPGVCTPGPSGPETCNGVDDDCDGMTDEAQGMLSCGVGVCAASVPACVAGAPNTCTPGRRRRRSATAWTTTATA